MMHDFPLCDTLLLQKRATSSSKELRESKKTKCCKIKKLKKKRKTQKAKKYQNISLGDYFYYLINFFEKQDILHKK